MIGMTGSLILCFSAIPQIVKTYRTKRAEDLSICYLGILLLGIILVMLYSLYIRNLIFIVGNGLSLFMTGMLVAMWLRYKRVK
jgi:MtN3 and saliva related transmembrane protein